MARWRRFTRSREETRAPVAEAVAAGIREAADSDTVSRVTYPSGDPMAQGAIKNYDVGNRARKITLYQAFLGDAWVSACVEAIAARLISGGWLLRPADSKRPNKRTKAPLQEYLDWCNEDEEFSQVLHSLATDLLWSGECYAEMTWKHSPTLHREVPYELYTVDVISMDYQLSDNKKQIKGYLQSPDSGEAIKLAPHQMLRIWFPDPKNKLAAFSPLEKLMNPLTLDQYIQLSEMKYFEQGNRGDVHINFENGNENLAERYIALFKEKFLGVKNAHLPLITWGKSTASAIGNRAQLDVLSRRKWNREEIMAVYKVSPHMVSIIEPGHVGGSGTGDVMEKQFKHTAVDPVRERICGQASFKIGVRGFGVTDWVIDTAYADLRDTTEITKIQTERIKYGLSTPDEERQKSGELPYEQGGNVPAFLLAREVIPVRDLDSMVSQQRIQSAQALQGEQTPEAAVAKGKLGPQAQPAKPGQQVQPDEEDGDGHAPEPTKPRKAPQESITEAAYTYGSTQFNLSGDVAQAIRLMATIIPPDALAADGIEDKPHVTVKYGLVNADATDLRILQMLCASIGPVRLRFGQTSIFQTPEYDVVKLDVEGSPELYWLNRMIGKLCQTVSTHPTYIPHATVAYVTSGFGQYCVGWSLADGLEATCDTLLLSDREGRTIPIPLKGGR